MTYQAADLQVTISFPEYWPLVVQCDRFSVGSLQQHPDAPLSNIERTLLILEERPCDERDSPRTFVTHQNVSDIHGPTNEIILIPVVVDTPALLLQLHLSDLSISVNVVPMLAFVPHFSVVL